MENEIKMTFLSKKCNIAVIRNMLGAMLVDNNPTITFINEVKTIVSEAVTNAIVHAYNNQDNKYIDLNIYVTASSIAIDIIDYGVGIENIELAKEALYSTKSDEERSGLGFTIMEMFSDNMDVNSKVGEGTQIHIEKKW